MKWFNQSRITTECTAEEKERFEGLYRTFRTRQWREGAPPYTAEHASRERWGGDASPPFVLMADTGMVRVGRWRNPRAFDEWPFLPEDTYELEVFFSVPSLGGALLDAAQSLLSEVVRVFTGRNVALFVHRDDAALEVLLARNGFILFATTPNGHQLMLRPEKESEEPARGYFVGGVAANFVQIES